MGCSSCGKATVRTGQAVPNPTVIRQPQAGMSQVEAAKVYQSATIAQGQTLKRKEV